MSLLASSQTLSLIAALFVSTSMTFASLAHAEDASSGAASSTKLDNPNANKVADQVDPDDMITNNNLRALSGSKSKWSLSNSITYDGGTIKQPFAESRPNISAGSGISAVTDINDQLSVKYNMNATNALLFGVGVRKMTPFIKSGPSDSFYAQGGKDMDIFDPSLTYQLIYKPGPIQAVLQIGFTQFTRQDIVSSNYGNLAQAFSIDQENIIEIGSSGLSIGASIGVGTQTPTDSSVDWSQYQYWFDPYVEYALNEKVNLRTVFNTWSYEVYKYQPTTYHDTVTQSVGVGFSVTRDLFIYPNVQFWPDNIRADGTNLGVTTTLNLF